MVVVVVVVVVAIVVAVVFWNVFAEHLYFYSFAHQ
jgi:hypothetical protein